MEEIPDKESGIAIHQIGNLKHLEMLLSSIVHISQLAFPGENPDWKIEMFSFNNVRFGFLFIATIGGEVVGKCQALPMSFINKVKAPLSVVASNENDWALTGVGVSPDHWNRLYGKRLTIACIDAIFKRMGESKGTIFVYIGHQREVSLHLHASLGFKEVYSDKIFSYQALTWENYLKALALNRPEFIQ